MEENKPQSDSGKPLDQELSSKRPLPNATATLILGIVSIPLCCCFNGIFGMVAAIVALAISAKDRKKYFENPEVYDRGSYKNLNAGRVCAIIGLILGALALLSVIVLFITGVISEFTFSTNTEDLEEIMKKFEELE
ncbi:CCC motif membrane protein [Halocola ammonii]